MIEDLLKENISQFLPGYFGNQWVPHMAPNIYLSIPSWILRRRLLRPLQGFQNSQFLPGYFRNLVEEAAIEDPLNSFLDTSLALTVDRYSSYVTSQFLPGYFTLSDPSGSQTHQHLSIPSWILRTIQNKEKGAQDLSIPSWILPRRHSRESQAVQLSIPSWILHMLVIGTSG